MAKQTIGEFLATLRKANGYTQQEVADRLGISNRTLSGWECDNVLPDILLLPALAELYGVTVDEILAGERKQKEEVKISNKAERHFLRSRYAQFSMQASLLLTFTIVGIILLFIGFAKELNARFVGFNWGLILLCCGIVVCVICIGLLFIFWKNAENNADNESELFGNYCLKLRKKTAIYLCVISALFYVCASVLILAYEANTEGVVQVVQYLLIIFPWFVVSFSLLLTAFLLWKKALKKWAKIDSNHKSKQIKKYYVILASSCLIPVILATVLFLPMWHKMCTVTVYENSDGGQFVKYIENYLGEDLPLSEIEKNVVVGEKINFVDDYWYIYLGDGVFDLFIDDDIGDMYQNAKNRAYRQELANGLTFYNLRYINNKNNEAYGEYCVYDRYQFESFENGARYVHTINYDYTSLTSLLGAIVLLLDVAVFVSLCLVKILRFPNT